MYRTHAYTFFSIRKVREERQRERERERERERKREGEGEREREGEKGSKPRGINM